MIKSRRLRWAGHLIRIEESRSPFQILTVKPTRKKPIGRHRLIWTHNIRMDLDGICINTSNWVDSVQVRDYLRAFVNAAMNLWVP